MTCDIRPGRRPRRGIALDGGHVSGSRRRRRRVGLRWLMPRTASHRASPHRNPAAYGSSPTPSLCIGCKACEVACKEWNGVPDGRLTSRAIRTTTRASSAPTRGDMSRSSSSRARAAAPERTNGDGPVPGPLADVAPTCASTAPRRRASTSVRPDRSSEPSSAPSSCRRTSATAAATAFRRARSA